MHASCNTAVAHVTPYLQATLTSCMLLVHLLSRLGLQRAHAHADRHSVFFARAFAPRTGTFVLGLLRNLIYLPISAGHVDRTCSQKPHRLLPNHLGLLIKADLCASQLYAWLKAAVMLGNPYRSVQWVTTILFLPLWQTTANTDSLFEKTYTVMTAFSSACRTGLIGLGVPSQIKTELLLKCTAESRKQHSTSRCTSAKRAIACMPLIFAATTA
jgi:hypothetical protein